MIISRTPFRISFFGGATDYPSWHNNHLGMILGATINKYCYLTVQYKPQFIAPRFRLLYSQLEECATVGEIQHPLIHAILQYLNIDKPLELYHASDLPARSGIGSSSAFAVGLLDNLIAYACNGTQWNNPADIAKIATEIEQDILKENVGSQDQILTAYGGINQIVWHPTGTHVVRPIELSPQRLKEFHSHLMLFYTGPRVEGNNEPINQDDHIDDLRRLADMANEGVNILTDSQDIAEFGILLDEAWQIKRQLSDGITNTHIDTIHGAVMDAGAIGCKLLGSGGGGFMLVFARPEDQNDVQETLLGYRPILDLATRIPFEFDFEGSKIIYASI